MWVLIQLQMRWLFISAFKIRFFPQNEESGLQPSLNSYWNIAYVPISILKR